MFGLLLFAVLLTGCKEEEKEKKPEDRLASYIELWEQGNFDAMYEDYLSIASKETYSREDMVDRYEKIYSDLEIDNVEVTFEMPEEQEEETEEDPQEVIFPIQVTMDSFAGGIQFSHDITLVKEPIGEEEEDWFVHWDTTYIFKELEDGDKVGVEVAYGPRGEIFDRNGKGLAINDKLTMIGIVPQYMEGHEEETKELVSDLLHLDVDYIEKQLNQGWVKPDLFVPLKTINPNDKQLFDELMEIPGVWPQDATGRFYPLGEAATHLVGYTGEITAEELEKYADKGYKTHDIIGKRGLEQLFEETLRGKPGGEIYIEKANGDRVKLASRSAQKGTDIYVTIDANVQQTIYDSMEGNIGAAAAIHPTTGETLALVSSPSFDPNGLTSNYYAALLEDESNPVLNRFTSLYAPGSCF